MARFYTNENFRFSVVHKLREMGHDVVTALDAGNANKGISDEDVLRFAINENRILITYNRQDFIKQHYNIPHHCGIIICSLDPDIIGQATKIQKLVSSEEFFNGKLFRINKDNIWSM